MMKTRHGPKAGRLSILAASRRFVLLFGFATVAILTVRLTAPVTTLKTGNAGGGAVATRTLRGGVEGSQRQRIERQQLEQIQTDAALAGGNENEEDTEAVDEAAYGEDVSPVDFKQQAATQVEAQAAAESGWGDHKADAESDGDGGAGVAAKSQAGDSSKAADSTDGAGGEGMPDQEGGWDDAPSPYAEALAKCRNLACLTTAARKRRRPDQFLFPHFFIVGWQKSATTSLYFHLRDHPQVLAAHSKEPEFFSDQCGYKATECPEDLQEDYIRKVLRLPEVLDEGLTVAATEASTHYGRNGQLLAEGLRKVFPWLKVVASMREPISRAVSMLAHNLDLNSKGCLKRREPYTCLKRHLPGFNYSEPWTAWVAEWPRAQLYLVQYENMTSQEHGVQVLRDIKRFLQFDPDQPAPVAGQGQPTLAKNNTRAQHLQKKGELQDGQEPDGWPIKRHQYEELLDIVRPDAESIATLVDQHGFADGKQWLQNWEDEWQATLDACDTHGNCMIYPNRVINQLS